MFGKHLSHSPLLDLDQPGDVPAALVEIGILDDRPAGTGSKTTLPATLRKATGSVEIAEPLGRLTLADRQTFNHLLAVASRRILDQDWHAVSLVDLRRYAAEARGGISETDNRRLKESIARLQETRVKFNYLYCEKGRVWEFYLMLGMCSVTEMTGMLEYYIPIVLKERLAESALSSVISLTVQ